MLRKFEWVVLILSNWMDSEARGQGSFKKRDEWLGHVGLALVCESQAYKQ